jgi:hypothetical protein
MKMMGKKKFTNIEAVTKRQLLKINCQLLLIRVCFQTSVSTFQNMMMFTTTGNNTKILTIRLGESDFAVPEAPFFTLFTTWDGMN